MKTVLNRFFRRLSIEHLWALVALAGVFIFLNLHPIRPHDFWWHLAVGREIVSSGDIPAVDAYSLTQRGQPYPSYNMFWLMELYFYLVYSLGGPALIVFGQSLMVGSAYAILLYLGWKRSGSCRLAAFTLLFAAALGMNDWNVRPQAITFLLAGVYLLAIHKLRAGKSKRWLLIFPLGMLVWANSHGSFFIGFVLLGLWLLQALWDGWRVGEVGGRWKGVRLPLPGLLGAGLAALLNPRGLGILSYLRDMLSSSQVQALVPEWAAPSFDTLGGALFLLGLLLVAVNLALSPKRPNMFQLLAFLFFAALGLKTLRGSVWFGIVMAPELAEHLGALVGRFSKPGEENRTILPLAQKLNALMAGLVLLSVLITLPWFKEKLPLPELKRGLISAETPVESTRFLLENQLPGALVHDLAYGSYLIWAGQPEYPVFVDPRIELYPIEHWLVYLSIINVESDWQSNLSLYGIQTLMLDKQNQRELRLVLSSSPMWDLVFDDKNTSVFTIRSIP